MRRLKRTAAVMAALLTFATATVTAGTVLPPPPPPVSHTSNGSAGATAFWVVFGCSGGVILAAWVANFQQHRQLTWDEAATCGLAFWFNPQRPTE